MLRWSGIYRAGAIGTLSIAVIAAADANSQASYTLKIVADFGTTHPAPEPLLLTDPNLRYPRGLPPRFVSLEVEPELQRVPDITWEATGGIHFVSSPSFGAGVPPEKHGDIIIERAKYRGRFTLTAHVGPPVDARATIVGYAYDLLALGCSTGNDGGARIDAVGVPQNVDRHEDADIFVTGPVNEAFSVFDHCANSFHDAAAKSYTLHVPGGGIFVDATWPKTFRSVSIDDVRGPMKTTFALSDVSGTLLWHTRDGRFMKTLDTSGGAHNFEGPTLMADDRGTFLDATDEPKSAKN